MTIDGAVYTLDAAGNRSSKTDDLAGVTSNYTYDKIYELTQVAQGVNTTEGYSYDPVGNSGFGSPVDSTGVHTPDRLSSLGLSPYNYNTSNELTSTPSASYSYDNNGNTASKTARRRTPNI